MSARFRRIATSSRRRTKGHVLEASRRDAASGNPVGWLVAQTDDISVVLPVYKKKKKKRIKSRWKVLLPFKKKKNSDLPFFSSEDRTSGTRASRRASTALPWPGLEGVGQRPLGEDVSTQVRWMCLGVGWFDWTQVSLCEAHEILVHIGDVFAHQLSRVWRTRARVRARARARACWTWPRVWRWDAARFRGRRFGGARHGFIVRFLWRTKRERRGGRQH
jgi:hypothetical protein